TVTDFDTGLMWVRQVAFDGMSSPFILDADDTFTWQAAAETAAKLAGTSTDGTTILPGTGNGSDTRLAIAPDLRARGLLGPRCARLPEGWRVHRSDLRAHGASRILVRHQGTSRPEPRVDGGLLRLRRPLGRGQQLPRPTTRSRGALGFLTSALREGGHHANG